jgi:hypothetical protein
MNQVQIGGESEDIVPSGRFVTARQPLSVQHPIVAIIEGCAHLQQQGAVWCNASQHYQ